MKRAVYGDLKAWLADTRRKPLILRGARQVGKTWLVRELARERGLALLEMNFERDPLQARAFEAADPRRVFSDLALQMDHRAAPQDSLLFIDEIQAAPEQRFPGYRQFGNNGIYAILQKPRTGIVTF